MSFVLVTIIGGSVPVFRVITYKNKSSRQLLMLSSLNETDIETGSL